jgi:concanavalin A-like lectin/glucanase superfamily protein
MTRRPGHLLTAFLGAQRPRTLAAACGLLVALTALPAHAQTCIPAPGGLVAWWPLDGSPNDIVGNNNPSSTNGVSYQQGQVLQGATFSQAPPGGILIPEGTLKPQKFTVNAWVKVAGPSPDPNPPYNDAHGSYIVAKPWNAYWPTIALTWSAYTGRFRFDFGTNNNQKFIDSAAFGPVGPPNYGPDGQFHHVAGTYDGATYRLYVDGDLKGSVNDTTPVDYNGIPWTIGTNYFTNSAYRTFNGVIDEVGIFDRALDQSEIKALYAAGTAGTCKPCAPPPPGLVAWWPGDGNAVDLISGISGTLTGAATYGTVAQGKVSQAFSFSGSGRVSLASAPTSNDFTIEAWVYPNQISSPNGYRTIYADVIRGLWLKNGRINWWSPSTDRFIGNSPPIAIKAWTHIALTYSNGVFTAYRNGAFDGSSSSPGEFLPARAGIGIGGYNNPVEDFDGLIDEVGIFNRALSQSQIHSLHAAGTAGKCKPKGMTWIHTASNAQTGTIAVGCSGCNANQGDTECSQQLPLLCIYKPTPAFQLPTGVNNNDEYNQWSGGVIATTASVAGSTFPNISATPPPPRKSANAYCEAQFGPGWRVAEFHDGRYWNFQAYGGTVNAPTVPSTRFWVHINDQPAANCWKTP